MVLTRLTIDPDAPGGRRDLENPFEMHRTLARAYATGPDAGPPALLWRPERRRGLDTVLVLSREPLAVLPPWLAAPPAERPFRPCPRPAMPYRFRLRANPTVTRAGRRQGLVGEVAVAAWLTRQGERCGFGLAELEVRSSRTVRFRKAGGLTTLAEADLEGVLVAVDPDRLMAVVHEGIGHGRAFGYGLLSLAATGAA